MNSLLQLTRPVYTNFTESPGFDHYCCCEGFPGGSVVKILLAGAGDTGDAGSVLGSGGSPKGVNGNLLQYSCLDNPMDRGNWQAAVHVATKSTHTHCCVRYHFGDNLGDG